MSKENTKSVISRACPNTQSRNVSEPLKKNISLNANKPSAPSKKTTLGAKGKAVKPMKNDAKTKPFPGTMTKAAHAKPDVKAPNQELNDVSFDSFTQASGSDFTTYRQSEITNAGVDDKPISHDHCSDDEPDMKEHHSVKNEVMDIANMLESLQLQTPAKPQIIKEQPKSVNFKTAGDGVCISTDGPCLTVLTPVRASRKAEKGIL